MLEIADELQIGAPWSSTPLYTCDFTCINCLGKTMPGWTHSSLVGVWAKKDLPWATGDHPMLEIAHDLHIGAPWSSTHLYTCDVHELFGEDHAWVNTYLTCRGLGKNRSTLATGDHPMLEIARDLHIGAPWSSTHLYTYVMYMNCFGRPCVGGHIAHS